MMHRRTLLPLGMAALVAPVAFAQPPWAPTRPIRMLVLFPPGGISDLMARLVAGHIAWMFGANRRPNAGPGVFSRRPMQAATLSARCSPVGSAGRDCRDSLRG